MLKACVSSPRAGFYGVEFETVVYGRKSYAHPSTFIPCASYVHAQAVAKAYNGVAFTETREPIKNDPAELAKQVEAITGRPVTRSPLAEERPAVGAALVAADMAELERKGLDALNHHGEPIAGGLSRTPAPGYRGAPMGVADFTAPDVTPLDTLHFGIRRVALDGDGYAPDGIYWGLPRNNLWHACATCRGTDHTAQGVLVGRWFRAPSYAHAVARVRGEFPNATTQRVP